MEQKQFSMIVMALKSYYPQSKTLDTPQAISLWYDALKDIDFKVCEMAVKRIVSKNKFFPSIAEIRQEVADMSLGLSDWGDGWQQVITAVRTYGMYNSKGALNSMDSLTREVVRRLGWTELCISENIQNDRANFRMLYEELAERKKAEAQIPEKFRLAVNERLGIDTDSD